MKLYETSWYTRFYRDYSTQRHQARLKAIRSGSYKKIDTSRPSSQKLLPSLKKVRNNRLQAKIAEVRRKNEKILEKIDDMYQSGPYKQSPHKQFAATLNFHARKQQIDNINSENEQLVRRLSNVSSQLSAKNLKDRNQFHNTYRKNRQILWKRNRQFVTARSKSMLQKIDIDKETKAITSLLSQSPVARTKRSYHSPVNCFLDNVKKYNMNRRTRLSHKK